MSIIPFPFIHSGIKLSTMVAPPQIFLPANMDKPESLTIIGNNSQLINTLQCAAQNAEHIEWKYRRTRTSGFQQIPKPFSQSEIMSKDDGSVYVSLSDADNKKDWRIRDELNSFYQCIAKIGRAHV